MIALVATVIVLIAALEVSRRWPTLGVAVAVGLIGLGVYGLADPPPHGPDLTGARGIGHAFGRFASVVIIAIGAIWLLASGAAVLAQRRRRTVDKNNRQQPGH